MAEKILNTTILLRNDATDNWQKENAYKLLKGEVGLEMLENGKVKMKVGVNDTPTSWSNLPYVGGDEAQVYQVSSLEELNGKPAVVGDIGIVNEIIAGEEIYTAYVYNGSKWAAMNGNYSAENVFVSDELTLAGNFESVGNYSKGEKIVAGTSLQEILNKMLQQELYPTSTMPTLAISASGGSGEVGSSYTVPTATLKVTSVGSYEFGPETGVTFGIGDVKLAEGSVPADATNFKVNTNVMALNSTLTLKASGDTTALYEDNTKYYTFSAAGTCTEGATPLTNLKNAYDADGEEGVKILSEIIEADNKVVSFSGYRYAFAGGTNANTIDSAVVRSMTAKKNSRPTSESSALNFEAKKGDTKVFFAYPSAWTGTPYFEMFGLAWGENSKFEAKSNIQVADARGTVDGVLQGAKEYKLYVWDTGDPLEADTTQFRVYFK